MAAITNTIIKKKKNKLTTTQSLWKITDSIYTCPFPAAVEDWEAFYRYCYTYPNGVPIVSHYFALVSVLQNTFFGRYKVYNLSGQRYDYHVFDGIVVEYPFKANAAPSIQLLHECVSDIVR